ncbi:UDP-glucuronosyltransferase [Aphelenchoides besseyi]|nr:UDP-glucuronosyltransferase [Aphelenchoides besseyi]
MISKLVLSFLLYTSAISPFEVSYRRPLRILFIASNVGHSHLTLNGRLADVLVDAGHEVDFLISMWNRLILSNGTTKAQVKRLWLPNTVEIERAMLSISSWNDAFDAQITAADWIAFGRMCSMHCDPLLSNIKLHSELLEKKYDVAMAEGFDLCSFALFRKLKIPSTHETSNLPLSEYSALAHGIPIDYKNVPMYPNHGQIQPIRSFRDRFWNLYEMLELLFYTLPRQYGDAEVAIKRAFGFDFPSSSELLRAVDYVWLNTNEQLEQPRALSPKIKSIGGIAVRKSGGLNEEMEGLLSNATEGAVLVSFGSIVDTTHMNTKLRDQFLEAFSRFPGFQFVWKVTRIDESLQSALKEHANVRAVEWMDQSGILEHTNTRAFITHGGLNSINEAATFGVPLITIPFFGDQHINSAAVVSRGLAVALDRRRISADSVASALARVLRSSKFELTAKDVKRKIATAPISPSEMFVRHVEFAAQHGGLRELQLPAASQSLWRQLGLDVWLTLLSGVLLLSVVMFWSLRVALNFLTTQTMLRMKNKNE